MKQFQTQIPNSRVRGGDFEPLRFPPTDAAKKDIKPTIRPSRPNAKKIANAAAPIMRNPEPGRIKALEQIAKMAGEKPELWEKPRFGDFEYWLAHNSGWISDEELKDDIEAFQNKRDLALRTSHRISQSRFTWDEEPRYEEPKETGEYVPEIGFKLIKDRNLTDSARRIAMFVMKMAYQDNREGRFIGITVSYIMKGLSLSRRTVQRSLTLLETRGYLFCEVAKGDETRMCVGLIIRLLAPMFPRHFKEKWPERRRNSGASSMPQKHINFYKRIGTAKNRVFRLSWALRCKDGVYRSFIKTNPAISGIVIPKCIT